MASEVKLAAAPRTEFGKGAARRLRRADQIPAVLYGHGMDPMHLSLPAHETRLALRVDNALLSLDIKGDDEWLALPKQIQRDPLKGTIEHVDLIWVRRGEKVVVDVQVELTGEAGPETLVVLENSSLTVEADVLNIPTSFEVSVEGAEVGHQVFAKDVVLPEGTTLAVDEDLLVVNVTNAPVAEPEPEEDAGEEGDGEGEAAEGDDAEGDSASE